MDLRPRRENETQRTPSPELSRSNRDYTKEERATLRARVLRAVEVEAALAHAEAAHLAVRGRVDLAAPVLVRVRGQLVVVEPAPRVVLRVAVLLLPVGEDVAELLGVLLLLGHCFLFLGDARGVVRRRREPNGLPDGLDLRGRYFQIDVEDRDVDLEFREEAAEQLQALALLRGLVHLES